MTLPAESTTLNEETASSAVDGQQTDAGKADSSTAAKGATKEPTSLDDVAEAFASAGEDTADPGVARDGDPEADAASDDQKGDKKDGEAVEGDEAEGQASEKDGDETSEDGDKNADSEADPSLTDATKPPPFHEHPRWVEVQDRLKAAEPLAEGHRVLLTYMQQNQITEEDLRGMLEIGALMQSNPVEAYNRLAPIVEGLGQLAGKTLPEDLEKQVAEGKLTPNAAQELAKSRAEAAWLKQQNKQTVASQRATAQQYMVAAVSDWATTKAKTDLAFKAGTPFYKFVDNRFQMLSLSKPPRTPMEAVRLAEEAYTEVKKLMGPATATKRATKPVGTKTVSSNGSSPAQKKKEPQTMEEVAMQATGVHWTVPKKGI